MDLLKGDIERHIEEVIRPLRQERNLLQNEQARVQGVLQNMAEGVVVVDEQGKILMMNPAAEQIYGTTLAEAAGKHLSEKAGEQHLVTLAQEISTPSERPISQEVQVRATEDTKRTVRASGAIIQNEAGKVVGMLSALTDVAKHKEFQRAQRDFVAHVTHELRAPLASIQASLEILQNEVADKLKEGDNRLLATAMKNSERLAGLINSILDFSKIESGQMTVYPKKTDPEKIAREAVESLGPWAVKKKVHLSLDANGQLPMVEADSQRMVQVLVNLLSNAIKFTPSGGEIRVRLRLSPEKFAGLGKFIEYAVADTGCGIAKADQKKVFEKFVQIAAGEMHVGGTGLGLAIAKALVHMQGGKMWLESEQAKGSTFLFTVPIYVPPREAEAPAAPLRASPSWWKRLLGLKK
jgi:PAS domain S-box-containing protein